ncbi:hypothetical protein Tco_0886893 [Tanacetum coccineum]
MLQHIHTRYHFIKEQVENGIIELYFVRTEYQLADMFTKALPEDRFKYLVRRIGMRCLTPVELEATTEPASSSGQPSAPKTSNVVNARRNNEKALNILLSAIPDRHLLSFHDAQDAKSLWVAIKARFRGNKESKKMHGPAQTTP